METTLKYKYKDSNVDWLGLVPEHWEVKRLGTWFEDRREKVSDKDFEPLSVTKNGILPQLENAAKSNDGDNRKLVRKGDFVINSRSDRKGSSGLSPLDGSVSLINIVMKPRNIYGEFINFLLKSNGFIEEFYRNGHGIVADLWTTRYDEMKFIKLAIPPLQEQKAIANFLDQKTALIDKLIDLKHQQIALLKEHRQGIIHTAVTKGLNNTDNTSTPLKDSGIDYIGQIPAHWQVKRLKNTLSSKLKYGANESGYEYSFDLPRYIRISDFGQNGKLNDNKKLSLPLDIAKDYLLQDGDILFARSGATVGKAYQFKTSLGVEKLYCFAGYLIKAQVNTSVLLSDFLYSYTQSGAFLNWKDSIFNKATIENIGADKYSELQIPLPPLAEQAQIVAYLEEQTALIDQAIAQKEAQIAELKAYKQSLINEVVTGKINIL